MRASHLALAVLLSLSFAGEAVAADSTAAAQTADPFQNPPCIDGVMKSATLTINITGSGESFDKAREVFEAQKRDMEAEWEKFGSNQIKINDYNYAVGEEPAYINGVQSINYKYLGTMTYRVASEEFADKLVSHLAKKSNGEFSMTSHSSKCLN